MRPESRPSSTTTPISIKGPLGPLRGRASSPRDLEAALELTERAVELFWDKGDGGFFFTSEATGLARRKELYDGAVPSGNSVMFMNLLRLARLTGRRELEDRASRLAATFASEVAAHPRMYTEFLCGLDYALGPSQEVVVVGISDAPETRELLAVSRGTCLWDTAWLFKPMDKAEAAGAVERLAPFTKGMDAGGGPAAAYVCSEGACLRPVSSAADLMESLRRPPERHFRTTSHSPSDGRVLRVPDLDRQRVPLGESGVLEVDGRHEAVERATCALRSRPMSTGA